MGWLNHEPEPPLALLEYFRKWRERAELCRVTMAELERLPVMPHPRGME